MSEKKTLNSTMIMNVLNYWYSFDFLGQSSLQTELSRQEKESLEYALNNEGQRQTHSITCRDALQEGEQIQTKVAYLLNERHMRCTGKVTIFLGSISKNYCIEQIIRVVGAEEQHEASLSKIALGSMQVGPSGEYIPNSFSLSPVLWSLSRITNPGIDQVPQGWLSKSEYDKENLSFEKTISEMNMSGYEDFKKITHSIIKEYISSTNIVPDGSAISEEINLNYRMYKNENEREKREGDYHGLTVDFYADDLAMVLSQVEELAKKGRVSPMQHALLSYIQSAFDMQKDLDITRHDLTSATANTNRDDQYNALREILDIRRAPLGKWPSRFMPFFMQQVAINLAIDEKHEKGTIFEDNGSMFSINGAPGTGKTTLIKEVIANNIVNRAILMAKYIKDPDDIFEECSFKHGPNPKTHAYAKYNSHYYRIKSGFQRLTNYAIVVASNNNAAVDNITVEIPDLKSIQDNLQPKDGDSADLVLGLEEVLRLFDPSSGKTEVRRKYNFETRETTWEEYHDLYFNSYADNLFNDERKTWGMISVPLGKKSNINRFYKKIMSEMTFGPLSNSRDHGLRPDERKQAYTAAVGAFLAQLRIVERLRDEIAAYIDGMSAPKEQYEKAVAFRDSLDNERLLLEKRITAAQATITELNRNTSFLNEQQGKLDHVLQQINIELNKLKQDKESAEYAISAIQEELNAGNAELKSLSFFQGKRKREIRETLEKKETLRSSMQSDLITIEKRLEEKTAEQKRISEEKRILTEKLQEIKTQIDHSSSEIDTAQSKIDEIGRKREDAQRSVLLAKDQMDAPSEQYHGEGVDQFRVFTPEYHKAFHSSDVKESVNAHLCNPWFTDRYNREREKLFYYAMLLNKEFVLASNCCRSNLSLLGMAWHTEVNPKQYYNDEVVPFAKEDLENCMTPLIQSLQLLVPVISTTFASVGSFFRYVKDSGSIGTLIIDEAGQAAPQTAIGALWRAYRAIVIGDPKQIEPVVTDDVSLLKTAYGEDVYRCYAEKTLSVQEFADYLNCYGTRMFDSEEDEEGQWIGSPLTVHRRCISPMYEISNYLSYSDTMKQVTPEPSDEVTATFSGIQTKWLNIGGKENGKKDHFVVEQGNRVLQLLDSAFKVFFENHPESNSMETKDKNSEDEDEDDMDVTATTENGPDLFIISPFNTVIEGMKQHLINNLTNPAYPTLSSHALQVEDWLTDWRNVHIGTVHKFQGREANEVIFLLGCDMNSARSANWVKKNIVNVAVTRAKYRLIIIGDSEVWKGCYPMMVAKRIIDTYALKKIRELTADPDNKENLRQATEYIDRIPSLEAFSITRVESQYGTSESNLEAEEKVEYIIDNETVLEEYVDTGLLCDLTDEQLHRFGYESKEMFKKNSQKIRRNLTMGINLYDLLRPMKSSFEKGMFDVSFLAIPFCIAIEQSMQENYFKGLQYHFPDIQIRTNGLQPLREVKQNEVTLGAFDYVIGSKTAELGEIMKRSERRECTEVWWEEYARKLEQCKDERNNCCHTKFFGWNKLEKLLDILFRNVDSQDVKGLFCEADAGRILNKVETI